MAKFVLTYRRPKGDEGSADEMDVWAKWFASSAEFETCPVGVA
jgi:hypothetical protein